MEADISVSEDIVGVQEERKISFERPEDEHPVLTLILFNTVQALNNDAVVTVAGCDLANAVRCMNNKYDLCDTVCNMSQLPVMLRKWTKKDQLELYHDLDDIAKKTNIDPFKPNKDALSLACK